MMVETRDLSPAERGVLVKIFSNAFPGAEELAAQIPSARVVGGIPTLLDLAVAGSAYASPCPDGPVPVRALVEDSAHEIEGEILVWVTNGYLSALEFAWITDEAPVTFPHPRQVRIE